jgi:Heparinase II/III-like protein
VAAGTFLWRHVARCEAEYVQDNATCVEVAGYHDGYLRLPDPVLHRRRLRLDKKARILVISDVLECRDAHDVEIGFHFSEACNVWQAARNVFLAAHGTKRLRLHLDGRLTPTLYRGSEQPMAGWVSRTFDVKVPTVTLMARGRITSTTEFRTEIAALHAGTVFS